MKQDRSSEENGSSSRELARLLAGVHPDPHAFLGAHVGGGGVVVRVFRPGAKQVVLLPERSPPLGMEKRHPEGLFEVCVPRRREVFPYRLEVHRPDGFVSIQHDAYAFLPTLGEYDLHLVGEGTHEHLYEKLGAHPRELGGVRGVSFAVWAPGARGVSVVGDFNGWDARLHPMRQMGSSGVWELFVPGVSPGALYKFELRPQGGGRLLKSDPLAFRTEPPPGSASVVFQRTYSFRDQAWMERRRAQDPFRAPLAIYEVHLGSWKRQVEQEGRCLQYRELAPLLAEYVQELGFTHVELLPVMEHPFGGSWGYQVSHYFAPTARFGGPDDLRFLVDYLHGKGIGVILDWVPAHFPKDDFALGRFDGTALYEHLDPRQGEHPDWGTFIFNYGRNEVGNFLTASALYWLSEYHADGLRLDAVASMLHLDYSRREGEWVPNRFGGRENLEAVAWLRRLNELAHACHPGVLMIAEESTAWPGVSRPAHLGGLGFGFKWNMGWMNDTLAYFSKDPLYRRYHHHHLTFGLLYAWSENFILPLSHDEVVHGKKSLWGRMPGDDWQRFANLRALYGYLWAHPGKKMLFMGGEFGQREEWDHTRSLDWHLVAEPGPRGVQALVRDLNRIYRRERALWECDTEPAGFEWIDLANADENVIVFRRLAPSSGEQLVCVCNFSPIVRRGYRVGLPEPGRYRELLNTDASVYGGSNVGNLGEVLAEPIPWHGCLHSAELVLPPLGVLWLKGPDSWSGERGGTRGA